MDRQSEISHLINELDSLKAGKNACEHLIAHGPAAIQPLRRFLLEGMPRKLFQPRFWAVEALARLGAKEVLLEYLFQEREIPDPEDRFGEEAVESAAARSLAFWPDEPTFQDLLKLSERRMLSGLIAALADYRRAETIPYFERALEDDFYRPAAEEAFRKLGKVACDALVSSALMPLPNPSQESPSSLERRRSALRLLNEIGMASDHWHRLRRLILESDAELFVLAARLGAGIASVEDRIAIAHKLLGLLSAAPWHLQEDMANVLSVLKDESTREIDDEIGLRMQQPENVRAQDDRLRALLGVKARLERTREGTGKSI